VTATLHLTPNEWAHIQARSAPHVSVDAGTRQQARAYRRRLIRAVRSVCGRETADRLVATGQVRISVGEYECGRWGEEIAKPEPAPVDTLRQFVPGPTYTLAMLESGELAAWRDPETGEFATADEIAARGGTEGLELVGLGEFVPCDAVREEPTV
jgi:hypothetical protein